jgi:hypothetical protein
MALRTRLCVLVVLAVVALVCFGAVRIPAWRRPADPEASFAPDWPAVKRAALELLTREHALFLVSERRDAQVSVTEKTGNAWLGRRDGFMTAPLRIHYGIDLDRLTEQDLAVESGRLVVKVPDPTVLDVSVELPAIHRQTHRSGLNVLADGLRGRNQEEELRAALWARACEYSRDPARLPSRESLVQRLNARAEPTARKLGVPIEFR